MKRKLLIKAGGGMGNRFMGIVNGLFFNEKCYNGEVTIYWKADDYACDCDFEDLFKSVDGINIIKEWPEEYRNKYHHISGEDPLNDLIFNQNTYDEIKSKDKVSLSQSNLIKDISLKDIVRLRSKFQPIESIQNKIDEFCNANDISKSTTYGVHIRRTDGSNFSDDFYIERIQYIINNTAEDVKIFICSDDKDTQIKIKSLFPNNVVFREKEAYTEKKFKNESWNNVDIVTDEGQTEHWKYNVRISKQAVIDGLIDMHILANTTFDKSWCVGGGGTFCETAWHMSMITELENL